MGVVCFGLRLIAARFLLSSDKLSSSERHGDCDFSTGFFIALKTSHFNSLFLSLLQDSPLHLPSSLSNKYCMGQ